MPQSTNLVNLDFDSLKNSLKEFLKGKPEFRDYNFEGSNINLLLEILAYNTYINGFYMNMIANEMFIKSSQIRENVVKHAIELNYIPRSFRSARAVVDISVTPANSSITSVVIPRGTSFTSRLGSNSFSFTVANNYVMTSTNGTFTFSDTPIYEGTFVKDTFMYRSDQSDDSNQSQRFILSNQQIDTDSIKVTVIEDGGSVVTDYVRKNVLSEVTAASPVFFLQASDNQQYEITFGSGLIGRQPKDGAVVICEYRVSTGELTNGADVFVSDGAIDGHSNVVLTTVSRAEGGAVFESTESIKFNAPRYFNTQNRAITVDDYKTLLTMRFPEIDAISVYGGEDVLPPQYGVVYISVNQDNSDGVSAERKRVYKEYIKTKTSLAIEPEFIDPEFIYVHLTSNVVYNINTSTNSEVDIKALVAGAISTFNDDNIDDFNTTLYFSKLTTKIDDSCSCILSNDTSLKLYKIVEPVSNVISTTLQFDNAIRTDLFNANLPHSPNELHAVISSVFTSGTRDVYLEDDGAGILRMVSVVNDQHMEVESNVGNVDYENGVVKITNVVVNSYTGNGIKIFVSPANRNVSVVRNDILTIRDSDVVVNVVGRRV